MKSFPNYPIIIGALTVFLIIFLLGMNIALNLLYPSIPCIPDIISSKNLIILIFAPGIITILAFYISSLFGWKWKEWEL